MCGPSFGPHFASVWEKTSLIQWIPRYVFLSRLANVQVRDWKISFRGCQKEISVSQPQWKSPSITKAGDSSHWEQKAFYSYQPKNRVFLLRNIRFLIVWRIPLVKKLSTKWRANFYWIRALIPYRLSRSWKAVGFKHIFPSEWKVNQHAYQ